MDQILDIRKFDPVRVLSVIYFDGDSKQYYVKRFKIEASGPGKRYKFITDHSQSKLIFANFNQKAKVRYKVLKGKNKEVEVEEIMLKELIDVKGWKALGNRLSYFPVDGAPEDVSPEEEDMADSGAKPIFKPDEDTESSNAPELF